MAKKNSVGSIITNIFIVIGIFILVINVSLIYLGSRQNDVPSLFGYKFLIELSNSMEETINVGDLVVIKEKNPTKIEVGDILSFKGDKDVIITHRVTDISKNNDDIYFETKGDNNASLDVDLVSSKNIEGVMVTRVRHAGTILKFLSTTAGKIITCLVIVIIFLVGLFISELKNEQSKKEDELIWYSILAMWI